VSSVLLSTVFFKIWIANPEFISIRSPYDVVPFVLPAIYGDNIFMTKYIMASALVYIRLVAEIVVIVFRQERASVFDDSKSAL
jgi:hypothetical protein